jgi:hypothetical protein
MHNTEISKVTSFGLRTTHHHMYALIGTYGKAHKLGEEISSPYHNHGLMMACTYAEISNRYLFCAWPFI